VTGIQIDIGRWYPDVVPGVPGESDDDYTERLLTRPPQGLSPYDHPRKRQCSIGYHLECSGYEQGRCECPCHHADRDAVEMLPPAVETAARVLCGLYHLPLGTGRRIMHAAMETRVSVCREDPVPQVRRLVDEMYGSKTGEWFAIDVVNVLRDHWHPFGLFRKSTSEEPPQ
jgi:hypothetical protein